MADAKVGEAYIELRYEFDRLATDLRAATGKLNAQVDKVSSGIGGRFKKAFAGVGQSLGSVQGQIGALAASVGSVNLFSGIIRTAGDFEAAMQQVAAVSGATASEMAQLEAEARRLGATTKFSASEAASAQAFLAQAGFTAQESLASLEGTLQLASAGAIELGESADIVSNVLSGFGLEAEKTVDVANILAGTFTQSNTNLTQLGQAFSFAAPVVAQTATSIEQASAALGVLGDAGIQATRAGTGLRGTLLALTNVTGPAEAALEGMGLTAADVDPTINSLSDILEKFGRANLTAGEASAIFGREIAASALTLVANRDRLDELTGSLERQEKTVAQVAATQNQGLNASLKSLSSAFQELQLAIADSGLLQAFTDIIEGVTGAVRSMSQSNPGILKFTALIVGVSAVVVPLVATLGLFAAGIAAIGAPVALAVAGIAGLTAAVVAFGDEVVAAITDPIGTAKAAFAALADAAVVAVGIIVDLPGKVVESMSGMADQITNSLTGGLSGALTGVKDFVSQADDAFFSLYDAVVGNSYIPDMVDGIAAHTARLQSEFVEPTKRAVGEVDSAFNGLNVTQLPAAVGAASSPKLVEQQAALNAEIRTSSAEMTAFGQLTQDVTSGLRQGFVDIAESIPTNFELARNAATTAADGIANGFADAATSGKLSFKDMANSIITDIGKMIVRALVLRAITSAINGAFGGTATAAAGSGAGASGSNFVPQGFRTGGAFKVGGNGGIDSKLVQFRATPGELVNVSPPGNGGRNGGGGGDLVVNVIDQRKSGEIEQRQSRGASGQRQIDLLILDSVNRGAASGQLDGSFGSRFGIKPQPAR